MADRAQRPSAGEGESRWSAGGSGASPGRVVAGLVLISAATLVLEIALTRVFAVVLWGQFAPMVVGTALLGFSLSGLGALFDVRPRSPAVSALVFVAGVLVLIQVIAHVPLRVWDWRRGKLELQALHLAIYSASLVLPFFGAGSAIFRLLASPGFRTGRLYAADLIGAAGGCLAIVPLLPLVGGEGTLLAAGALGAAAAAVLAGQGTLRWVALAAAALLAAAAPRAGRLFPLYPHQSKREYNRDVRERRLLYTRWTALSRIDVAPFGPGILRIWIDGGTNESAMFHSPETYFARDPSRRHSVALPYLLKEGTAPRVMIIGPAGGKEVYFALASGARHVDAVEMDAGVVHVVSEVFDDFLNGLYRDPRVRLVNDEARSFVRRSRDRYDVIQSVNNYSPVALLSGALNLSESFLLTEEAFHDYLDHLNPGGLVAFHRGASLRLAGLVAEVLEQRGVERPGERIVVIQGERWFFDTVLVKNGPFEDSELETVDRYAKARGLRVLYRPGGTGDPLYVRMVESRERDGLFQGLGVDLSPPTDDRPFLDHYTRFGKSRLDARLPLEFQYFERLKWWRRIPRGDVAYVAILAESAVFAALLLGIPAWRASRRRSAEPARPGVAAYFACLGVAFVLVELCLMKSVVLFLGHPTYSISVVLVALLAGAAAGSLLAERLERPAPALAALIAVLLAESWAMPVAFRAALGLEFAGRVAVAVALLFPLAVCMGLPFPTAFQILRERAPGQLPLAWAANGYGTVVGSGLTVFLAVFLGFRAAYLTAAIGYGLAALVFPRDLRAANRKAGRDREVPAGPATDPSEAQRREAGRSGA